MARLAFLMTGLWVMCITASVTATRSDVDGRVQGAISHGQHTHRSQEHPFINLPHDEAVDLHREPQRPGLLPVGPAATSDVFKSTLPTPPAHKDDNRRRLNTPFDLLFQVLYVSDDDKAEVKTEKEEEEEEKKKAEQQQGLEEESGTTESTAGSHDWLSAEYQSKETSHGESSQSAHSDADDRVGSIPSGSRGTSTTVMPIPSSTSSESTRVDSFKTLPPVATTAQPSLASTTTVPTPPLTRARIKSVAATVENLGVSVAVAIVGTVATTVW